MREIAYSEIADAVCGLCIEANTILPADLRCAIEGARAAEASPVGRAILGDLVENYTFAAEKGLPICQDTGMAVVFAQLGQEVHITGGLLEDAVNEGVARGYAVGRLRCSVVGDPLRRENTGDNTPAVLHLQLAAGDKLRLTVAPKGFGSENMTALKMLNPSAGREDILDFIVDAVSRAGSRRWWWGWAWAARRSTLPCWQRPPCCARWAGAAATPSTPPWRPRPWSASTPWASAPRGWAGPPPRCRYASCPPPPTSRACPAASTWAAM